MRFQFQSQVIFGLTRLAIPKICLFVKYADFDCAGTILTKLQTFQCKKKYLYLCRNITLENISDFLIPIRHKHLNKGTEYTIEVYDNVIIIRTGILHNTSKFIAPRGES